MPSFLSGWGYRKAIKYGTTKPGSNLTAFPTLLKIVADTDIGAVLSSRKFAVTDVDGVTQIPYGNYNDFVVSAGACTATLRFKQTLSSSAATGDVMGYLYYDQSQTDQANRAGVLDSFTAVLMPMEEDPSGSAPQMVDWSGNNNGTTQGSMTSGQLVAAEVVNGLNFTGSSSQGVNCGNGSSVQITGDCTVSFWMNFPDVDMGVVPVCKDSNVGGRAYDIDIVHSTARMYINGGAGSNIVASAAVLSNSTFFHVAGTYHTDGTLKIYVNGSLSNTQTGADASIPSATAELTIAHRPYTGFEGFVTGIIDEVNVASTTRSADWIAYAYQNDKNNSATVTLGAQETAPAATGGLWLIKA